VLACALLLHVAGMFWLTGMSLSKLKKACKLLWCCNPQLLLLLLLLALLQQLRWCRQAAVSVAGLLERLAIPSICGT
jgi:hypothetical protein